MAHPGAYTAEGSDREERRATVAEFLCLPAEALPSAAFIDDDDMGGAEWAILRSIARERETGLRYAAAGSTIRLRADRPEWRDGVHIKVWA